MRDRKQYIIMNSLISLSLFFSILLRADILDGGEIQFNGFVTDEAPKWTWQ
ncbi:fimbrial protein, partial [Escherichia coli]